MQLTELLARHYIPARLGQLKPKSVRQIEIAIGSYSRWLGHQATTDDLVETSVREWLSVLAATRSPATINSKRRIILGLWNAAYDDEVVDRPPRTSKVKLAKQVAPTPRAWTVEELGRLFRAASQRRGDIAGVPAGRWWLALLLTLYDTGARKSEALAVAPNDVDLDARLIEFRQTKTGTPRICRLHTDTVASIRLIHDPGRSLLWEWPFSEKSFYSHFHGIAKAAGLDVGQGRGGCLHRIRKTTATLTEAAGGSGHQAIGNSAAICSRHYIDRTKLPSQLDYLPRPELGE